MNPLDRIAEMRLREALERGDFDDLPDKGKPIRLEDISRLPQELRIGYLLLRTSGCLPEVSSAGKDALTLGALLHGLRGVVNGPA